MNIIYEDPDILVCHKEAGLAVQSARLGQKDLESMLLMYLRQKEKVDHVPYLSVVHRLDQPVEGLLVFARNKKAAAFLSQAVRDGGMKKTYRALCVPDRNFYKRKEDIPAEKTLRDYLVKDPRTNLSSVTAAGTKGAREAVLDFRIIPAGNNRWTAGRILLEISLHTGRHHQIRVQLANAHLPIAGDRKYGGIQPESENGDFRFPALCAYRLDFIHPGTGRKMTFVLDEDTLAAENSGAKPWWL